MLINGFKGHVPASFYFGKFKGVTNFDFSTFKGRLPLISAHIRGKLFSAKGFFNGLFFIALSLRLAFVWKHFFLQALLKTSLHDGFPGVVVGQLITGTKFDHF